MYVFHLQIDKSIVTVIYILKVITFSHSIHYFLLHFHLVIKCCIYMFNCDDISYKLLKSRNSKEYFYQVTALPIVSNELYQESCSLDARVCTKILWSGVYLPRTKKKTWYVCDSIKEPSWKFKVLLPYHSSSPSSGKGNNNITANINLILYIYCCNHYPYLDKNNSTRYGYQDIVQKFVV